LSNPLHQTIADDFAAEFADRLAELAGTAKAFKCLRVEPFFPPELSTGMTPAYSCGSIIVDELVSCYVPTLSTIRGWSGTSERSSRNGTSRGSYAAGLCHLLWQHGGSLPYFAHERPRSPVLR
jgi:hypothetical protein